MWIKDKIAKFLGGIDLKDFLSNCKEWHAFVEGVGDGFCPWDSRYEPSEELEKDIVNEHHYYSFGTVIGFTSLIFAVAGAVRLVLGAIL